MRRGVAALTALVVVTTAAQARSTATLVTGTVVLDPARPICRPGRPCTRPLGGFGLAFSRDGAVVARTKTNRRGHYSVTLKPGIYHVTHSPKGPGAGLSPKRISVPAAKRVIRRFRYDAGIR